MDHDAYLAALLQVAARADRDESGGLTERGRAQLAALDESDSLEEALGKAEKAADGAAGPEEEDDDLPEEGD